jgi:ketosteroid isomerase-like protein
MSAPEDAAHFLAKADEYSKKAEAVGEPGLKAALVAVAREYRCRAGKAASAGGRDQIESVVDLQKRIHEIYELISSGKLDLLADVFDENVDFRSNAPVAIFSYLGHRFGRAEVVKVLWAAHGEFKPLTLSPIWVVAAADTAAVLLSVHATQRSSGRVIRFLATHFLRFRAGRISDVCEVIDSFEAVQQVLGREFDVPRSTRSCHIK